MSRFIVGVVATLCLVLLTTTAHGWWCNGHMLVAEIAKRHLTPNVSALMDEITANLSASGPFPMSSNFVELACWSDDIKAEKLYSMGGWHYINTPYNPENISIKKWPVEDQNVKSAVENMVTVIKGGVASPYTINFAVGNLVHFYGDIHQPLHASTFFSDDYPKGDQGGNLIHVTMNGEEMKLHAVWDSICQGSQVDPPRPLSSEDYAKVKKFADYLIESYQFTDGQKAETDAEVFSRESYEYAVMATYNGVKNGTVLSDAYISRCKCVAEARVALAGYRLATQLNKLFG